MASVKEPAADIATLFGGLDIKQLQRGEEALLLFSELRAYYETLERGGPEEEPDPFLDDEDVKAASVQASLLFVARGVACSDGGKPEGRSRNMGLPISKIIAASGVNLLDFFREVNVVVSKLSPWFEARNTTSGHFMQQTHLKENAELVIVLGLLAKKYKDQFSLFLHQLDMYKQVVMRMGWVAFLCLKAKLLSQFADVVSCMELLPCIFVLLVSHAPRLPDGLASLGTKPAHADLLKCLCEASRTDYSRVLARMPSVEVVLSQIFTQAVPEWRSAAASKLQLPAQGVPSLELPEFPGLVTDIDKMNCVVAALEREYEQHLNSGGTELDERDFLATDFSKYASPRFSPRSMHSAFTKLRSGSGSGMRHNGLLGPGAHMASPSQPLQQMPLQMMGLSGLHSPLPIMHLVAGPGQPATPMTELMGAAAWLRGITSNLPAEPSQALQRHLNCLPAGATAAQQLIKRVRDMVAGVIPDDHAPSMLSPFPVIQQSLAAERRTEALKLYYHSLDSIVASEEKVGGAVAVQGLLASTKFHRGLVACCVEVVAACYRMVVCAFPRVLDGLRLKAFDLCKMIHSFVRSIATLPRDLKRHLFLIEEKILESLAWEPGSSLYHLILHIHNEPQHLQMAPLKQDNPACSMPAAADDDGMSAGAADAAKTCNQAPPSSNVASSWQSGQEQLCDASMQPGPHCTGPPPSPKRSQGVYLAGMMSPAKKARGNDSVAVPSSAWADPSTPLPVSVGGPPCVGSGGAIPGHAGVLHEFLRKVLKLSLFRLTLLCENFEFSPLDRAEVVHKVYETIEFAVYHQTQLYYNRHIDQIMLSALYGYCKVHKLSQVSFREIITHYRKQPQAQQPIFRSVITEQTNPGLHAQSRADIISFYNQVFVPAMKSFLLNGEHASTGITAGSGSGQGMPSGLPPLPPKASSQSPHSHPKLPPLSTLPQRSSALLAPPGGVGSAVHQVALQGADPGALQAPAPTALPQGNLPAAGFSPGAAAQAAGISKSSPSMLPSGLAGVPPRPPSRAQERKIPGGLAALLQALDSQQDSRPGAASGAPGAAPMAASGQPDGLADVNRSCEQPSTPTEGLNESMSASSASQGSQAAQPSSACAAPQEGALLDAEGMRDMGQPGGSQGQASTGEPSRRQRTPNRRYLSS